MTTPELTIKQLTYEEYQEQLRKELEGGLYEAVKARCYLIDEATNYWARSYIQEQLMEIRDLVLMYEQEGENDGK